MKYLLTLLMISPAIIWAQKPKEYHAFDKTKELIFTEDFLDDRNGWLEDYECESLSMSFKDVDSTIISNSMLKIDAYSNRKGAFKAREILPDIDYSKNYEITFKVRLNGPKDKHNVGVLYWGRDCATLTGYNLYFDTKGRARMFYSNLQFEDSIHPDVDKFMYLKSYYKKDFNTFTIRRYDDKYYIFANRLFLGKCRYVPLTGSIIGLGKTFNHSADFDYINIYYLP